MSQGCPSFRPASWRRRALALLLAATGATTLAAAPGDLVAVTDEGLLRRSDVDAAVRVLFRRVAPPSALYPVAAYLVRFESRYHDGATATVTAQLFVPEGAPLDTLYMFLPGTTGLIDRCRVSREHIAGINWGRYRSHALAFAGQGVVSMLPDYPGFGDPERLQSYFHTETEAQMVLNGIRAAGHLLHTRHGTAPPRRVFLGGYSQGGHAMFAAADTRASLAPDLAISGVIGYGPTRDVATLLREFTVAAPMLIYTYAQIYGADRFDPTVILKQQWLDTLTHDVTHNCIGAMQNHYSWSAADMFSADFLQALRQDDAAAYPTIAALMAANSPGLAGHGVPALILQGTDDIVIAKSSQDRFVEQLRAAGSSVRYVVFAGGRHDTRQVGFQQALAWMQEAGRHASAWGVDVRL